MDTTVFHFEHFEASRRSATFVDPNTQLIQFLVNEAGRFVVQSPVNDCYRSTRLSEFEIQVADFWRDVDKEMSVD